MSKMTKHEDIESKLDLHRQHNRQAPDSQGFHADPAQKGVTTRYLAQVFDLHHQTVLDRLRNCPPLSVKARGTKMKTVLYDLKVAAAYLVTPALPTETYLRHLRRGDLPPSLQQQAWDALLKRQKWEENAGDLWRTDKVREVLRDTFQQFKFTTQLWVDTVERQTGLTNEQRELIVALSDTLLAEVHEALVTKVSGNETGSQLDELPGLIGESAYQSPEDDADPDGLDMI